MVGRREMQMSFLENPKKRLKRRTGFYIDKDGRFSLVKIFKNGNVAVRFRSEYNASESSPDKLLDIYSLPTEEELDEAHAVSKDMLASLQSSIIVAMTAAVSDDSHYLNTVTIDKIELKLDVKVNGRGLVFVKYKSLIAIVPANDLLTGEPNVQVTELILKDGKK